MKTKCEKGVVSFDACEFVESLDIEAKRAIARAIIADEDMFSALADQVATGSFFDNDKHPLCDDAGWWSIGDVTKLRLKLLPLMPEVTRELVRQLVRDRKQALALKEQRDEEYWEMWHAWPSGLIDLRPDSRRKFPHVKESTISKEVTELLGPESDS